MVDHHPTNPSFGQVNLLNVTATATAEILVDWLEALALPLSKDTATALLTGIVTDTLCFRVSSVTSDTFGKAQKLMAAGAALVEVTQHTVNRRSAGAFRLWARVMPTIQIEDHVIWIVIDKAARAASGLGEDESDGGLSALLIEADDAYVSATFRETKEGRVELSFRAVPGFNVSQTALSLGGGGHIQAAGATVDGPLADVVARVIPLLKAAAAAGTPIYP
jgi:phosphoesterase RecJ-like protein